MNNKAQVAQVLAQDWFHRRQMRWPLVPFSDLDKYLTGDHISRSDDLGQTSQYYYENHTTSNSQDLINGLYDCFPELREFFNKYKGKIVVAGGLLTRIFKIKYYFDNVDCDLFFYGIKQQEARAIIFDFINILSKVPGNSSIKITHKLYVTTIVLETNDMDTRIYQFIHRIYPRKDLIIGGFDLGPCMILFDGDQILFTPLGAYSFAKSCLIVDTTRRSTSFEYRITKYHRMGFQVVFPGIPDTYVKAHIAGPQDFEIQSRASKIFSLMKNLGLRFDRKPEISSYNQILETATTEIKISNSILALDSRGLIVSRANLRQEIPPALLNKYTDYGSTNVYIWTKAAKMNLNYLVVGNLDGFGYYIFINDEFKRKPYFLDLIIDWFDGRELNSKIGEEEYVTMYRKLAFGYLTWREKMMNTGEWVQRKTHKEIQLFAEYVPEIRTLQETITKTMKELFKYDRFDDRARKAKILESTKRIENIVNILTERVRSNYKIICQKLQGISFIEQDPQRQWTSSINPIMQNPREFYGEHYHPFWIGIPVEIETTLRLIRRSKEFNVLWILPKDLFNLFLSYLFRAYVFNPQDKQQSETTIIPEVKDFKEPVFIFAELAENHEITDQDTLKFNLNNKK
jgi:hypothetical protein